MNAKKALLLAVLCAAAVVHAEFKAGFARVDATPPLGIPVPGYFSHRVSNGVLDPLCIECVAVSDGTNAALIYCVDDLHLTNPFFKEAFPAITAATLTPARAIRCDDTIGSLDPGKCADFVLLNQDLSIRAVFIDGKQIVGKALEERS